MLDKRLFFLILVILCCLSDISAVLQKNIKKGQDEHKIKEGRMEIQPIEEVHDSEPILVNGIIYKAFKKYYCMLFDEIENRRTLLHGIKGWTFPRQDVNLTLAYPSADVKVKIDEDYIITGYQVILFTDGWQGNAFINSGGMLQDTISLTFISRGITTLSYQFWLYGARRTSITADHHHNVMC